MKKYVNIVITSDFSILLTPKNIRKIIHLLFIQLSIIIIY